MNRQRGSRDFIHRAIRSLSALLILWAAPLAARAQFAPDEEDNPYRPGLIARYIGSDGAEHVRLEERLSHAWGQLPPDRRVPPGSFAAHFGGRLWTQVPGTYRLHVFAAGTVRLELAGKLLLEAQADEPGWLEAQPVELPFGFHPLEIEYRRGAGPAQIALYWEGPHFGFEPVAARWLFHDADQTPSSDFERGEQLARALRCAACHELPGEPPALKAPALDRLAGNLQRGWLVDWLSGAIGAEEAVGGSLSRRMPHFNFHRAEAESIADALFAASEPLANAPPEQKKSAKKTSAGKRQNAKKKKGEVEDEPPPSAVAGATLFRSVGCVACHRVGDLGSDGPFGGGALTAVADKRPDDFFARWLADPARVNRDHHMPVFALDDRERECLSLYLQTLRGSAAPATARTAARAEAGERLVREARCAACHTLPKSIVADTALERLKLAAAALERNTDSCLFEPAEERRRPGYRLNEQERSEVRTFIAGIGAVDHPPVARTGAQLLAEHNCLACHARGAAPGIAEHLPAVAEADPSLRDLLPLLQPPPLFGVGDKLRDEALAAAIRTPESPRRAWLHVRMPKFSLSDEETALLVRHFVEHDRIPPHADPVQPAGPPLAETALDAAGPRLVTADGFGCTSCHAIGDWTPQKVAPGAQGAPLSHLGKRIRHEWFDRWVRDPARIVPKMEMPAVQQSIRGVLDRRLDAQLTAVWRVLNRSNFTPPAPDALRVVRRANLPDNAEPAAVLTEVIRAGGVSFVKPLVVGLPNRHNVLVDLETNRLAAWWIGDAARQRTTGKSWYWDAGQPQLLPIANKARDADGDLLLVRGDERIGPVRVGQYVTEFDVLEHTPSGLRVTHRLHFPLEGRTAAIRVVQQLTPLGADAEGRSGFRRSVQLANVPRDTAWELVALAGDATLADDGRTATLAGPHGAVQVSLAEETPGRFERSSRGAVVLLATSGAEPPACTLDYRSQAVPDQFAPLPPVDRSAERAELDVVPGFEAVCLPLSDRPMPTGLAWRNDGKLVVSSLEGRVWQGYDDDGDGLEDRLEPFSDELAAPYGVATTGDAVDVINKYGLLRLFDEDGDGRAERTELLASGWGHTRDYHDWVMGLPRDAEGNYYISLPCEQDKRSQAGAMFRGQALRLEPRTPSDDDPRRFSLYPIAAGLRFPQGIALSRERELFVTDQQGHYNPFNELNHVRHGVRFGFINSLERKAGFNPPAESPAVEIPHPWTRSVNGICFLYTPEAVRAKLGGDLFGPFEGHLVGCEYNNRQLVRMSLERTGDTFQGAVYPLSREPQGEEPTFEGPLVCQVAPDGDLYVGNIRDSGWGAGTNTGSIVRMAFTGDLPPGIAEVRAVPTGFAIHFTAPVDRRRAAEPENYAVSSFRRISTPAYGGDDKDRRVETIRALAVSDDARSVTLGLGELREGFVYEFHLRNLSGGEFFPGEAYYTLRQRPQ